MVVNVLIILKPNAVKRCITGQIMDYIHIRSRLVIKQLNRVKLGRAFLMQLYHSHKEKSFFNDLIDYMSSDNCYIGYIGIPTTRAVERIRNLRQLLGPTDASTAPHGTIRGDFKSFNPVIGVKANGRSTSMAHNACANIMHVSDSIKQAKRECKLAIDFNYILPDASNKKSQKPKMHPIEDDDLSMTGVSKRSNEVVSSTAPTGFGGSNPSPSTQGHTFT